MLILFRKPGPTPSKTRKCPWTSGVDCSSPPKGRVCWRGNFPNPWWGTRGHSRTVIYLSRPWTARVAEVSIAFASGKLRAAIYSGTRRAACAQWCPIFNFKYYGINWALRIRQSIYGGERKNSALFRIFHRAKRA